MVTARLVTQRFIDELREIQYALQCEWSMNQVEKRYRVIQYEALEVGYLEQIVKQKRHYTLMYLLIKYYTSSTPSFPSWYLDFLQGTSWNPASVTYPRMAAILQRCLSVSDSCLIDVLTFCGLPCYFDFFFTDFGVSEYIQFLSRAAVNFPLYVLLSRMAFVSSFFLSFITTVFIPILSPLLPYGALPSIEDFSAQIITRWNSNINAMPSVVVQLLTQSPDPVQALSGGFFELALTPKTARLYGLVQFNQILPEPLLDLLRQLLTASSPSHILNHLIATAKASKSAGIQLLTAEDRKAIPALFQRLLMTQVDFNSYSAASIHGQFVDPVEYKIGAYLRSGETEQESLYNVVEMTMSPESIEGNAAMRHLLQAADPVPVFVAIAPNTTVECFFRDYLLNRGPIDEYPQRHACYQALERWSRWDPRLLQAAFRDAPLERTKEIAALSAFTRVTQTYLKLDQLTRPLRDSIRSSPFSWSRCSNLNFKANSSRKDPWRAARRIQIFW
jgi:hypothetical protein